MREDVVLIGAVFAIWLVLSIVYLTVPMLHMPGAARVWGLGAVVFLLLALWIALSGRGGGGRSR